MKTTWELDDNTVIEAKFGLFGRSSVRVDDVPITGRIRLRKKHDLRFELGKGRQAVLSVHPGYVTATTLALRVDGHLMVESRKDTTSCPACRKRVVPNDRFCASCGAALPSAEQHSNIKSVADATGAIRLLAWLFMISGAVMFFIAKSQSDTALADLSLMAPDALIPYGAGGETATVGAMRAQLVWEPWGLLAVNLVLALTMAVLAWWGKKAPLAAMLVATATYAVVVVVNAMLDPATIAQGLFLKVFIIAILAKGIRSGIELRPSNG